MNESFDYLIFPVANELKLTMDNTQFHVERIYGSPGCENSNNDGSIDVLTVFPSEKQNETETKGGIIIMKVKPNIASLSDYEDIHFHLSYIARDDSVQKEEFVLENPFYFNLEEFEDNPLYNSLRKGVLLTRYVNLMKHWSVGNSDLVSLTQGIPPFDSNTGKGNETKEDAEHFENLFKSFHSYFVDECEFLNDDSLSKEEKLIKKRFSESKSKPDFSKIPVC